MTATFQSNPNAAHPERSRGTARHWPRTLADFHVYILRCTDGSYYTGHTDNLEMRIAQHQSGRFDGYTAARLPVALAYVERFQSREAAFAAERRIKNWSRAKKQALIDGDWQRLSALARPKAAPRAPAPFDFAQGGRNGDLDRKGEAN